MSNLSTNIKKIVVSPAIIYWLLITLLAYGFKLTSSNLYNQMPVIDSWLDRSLYNQDFYIQEMGGFTPRFYYYSLIYLPAKLGASLTGTLFAYFIASFFSFSLAVRAIGKLFYVSEFSSAILLFLFLSVSDGTIGYVDIYRIEPIPAIYAMGISIWGIYYCFQKKWNTGYLLFSISCFMQILVGFIPGLLFVPLLCKDAFLKKDIYKIFTPVTILFAFVLSVYLPMKFLGGTSSELIDSQDFIFLYGYVRHSHHIIFSWFGLKKWLSLFSFFLSTAIALKMSSTFSRENKLDFFILLLCGSLILASGYIFVELIPISLVAKMQLARVTPFLKVFALIIFGSLFQDAPSEHKSWPILLLGLMSITVNYGSFTLPVFLLLLNAYKQSRKLKYYEFLISTILFVPFTILNINAIYLTVLLVVQFSLCQLILSDRYKGSSSSRKEITIFIVSCIVYIVFMVLFKHQRFFIFAAVISPFLFQKILHSNLLRNIFFASASIALSSFLILGYFQALPPHELSTFKMSFKFPRDNDNELIRIARRFNANSHPDALVLVPPSDEEFRYFSQRSLVFTFKSFPFTDRGMMEWRDRYQTILGTVPADLDRAYQDHSSTELVDIGNHYGADYILSRKSWHPDLEGSLIDTEGEWNLWFIKAKE